MVEVLQGQGDPESAAYVKDALKHYPDISVMTTTAFHAHLAAMGLADQVENSGVDEDPWHRKIEAAAA